MSTNLNWQEIVDYRVIDTWGYIRDLRIFLPKANNEQVMFLWERSQKEIHAIDGDPNEHEFFGYVSMAAIAPYIPIEQAPLLIELVEITQNNGAEYKGITLAYLSRFLDHDARLKYVQIAWKYALMAINHEDSFKQIASQLPSEFAWEQWQRYLEKIENESGWLDHFRILGDISQNIPLGVIPQAVEKICQLAELGTWPERKALFISTLINRFPESERIEVWNEIFKSILRMKENHEFQKLHQTAAELILYMPEDIRMGKFAQIIDEIKKKQ